MAWLAAVLAVGYWFILLCDWYQDYKTAQQIWPVMRDSREY